MKVYIMHVYKIAHGETLICIINSSILEYAGTYIYIYIYNYYVSSDTSNELICLIEYHEYGIS